MKYILLIILLVSSLLAEIPKYQRKYFRHWIDKDRDGQNTRVEVLIDENIDKVYPLEFKTFDSLKVISGMWFCKYTGKWITDPRFLDLDHVVPLKNAWISGAYKWSPTKRKLFANYLLNDDHLIMVTASSNRQKGAKSPDQWLPTNPYYHVQYCKTWLKIKIDWNLTVTEAELLVLKRILKKEKIMNWPEVRMTP